MSGHRSTVDALHRVDALAHVDHGDGDDCVDRVDHLDRTTVGFPVVWKDLGEEGSNPRRTANAVVDAALGAYE